MLLNSRQKVALYNRFCTFKQLVGKQCGTDSKSTSESWGQREKKRKSEGKNMEDSEFCPYLKPKRMMEMPSHISVWLASEKESILNFYWRMSVHLFNESELFLPLIVHKFSFIYMFNIQTQTDLNSDVPPIFNWSKVWKMGKHWIHASPLHAIKLSRLLLCKKTHSICEQLSNKWITVSTENLESFRSIPWVTT